MARETATTRAMREAREERQDPNNIAARQCAHPQNVEYALFFAKMQMEAEEAKPDGQWAKTLGRVAYSVCKLPTRVRSLEQANAINGVGPKTLELFRKYLTAYPPDPPSEAELRADDLAAEAARVAKEAEKARKKAEREAKKRGRERAAAADARADEPPPQRQRYDTRGGDDDVIVLDSPPTSPAPRAASAEPSAAPAGGGARRAKADPKPKTPKRWEPGYRTAPFALLVTLHRLHLQGDNAVSKQKLMDEAEESGLSAKGIHPKGDAGARNVGGGGYRVGGGPQFTYSGWTCFNKQLKSVPKGWDAPMVHAWSNPLKIRLTDEGKTLAFKLHVAAESRGDCRCGLVDVTSSEAKAALADETVDAGARNRAEGWRAASGEGGGRGASRNEAAPSTSPNAANAAANPRDAAAAAAEARANASRAAETWEIPTARGVSDPPAAATTRSPSASEIRGMPVRDLKRLLESRSVSIAAVVEKSELVDLAIRSVASGASMGGARDGADATKTTPAKEGDDDVMIVLDDEEGGGGGIDRESGGIGGASSSLRSLRRNDAIGAFRLPPLPPGARFADVYDVVLLVDNREQFGSRGGQSRSEGRLEHVRQLSRAHGVRAEVTRLECGDATWVARCRAGNPSFGGCEYSGGDGTGDYVLDFVLERKRLDDLSISIKDDRYRQQKFFLKRGGVRHLGYLVEGDVKEFEDHPSITEQSVRAIKSAAAQTEIFDGFRVIRTENLKDTHDLLGRMTVAARELYANLTAADGATPSRDESHAPPTLAEYNASLVAAKRGLSTLKTVWGSMLMQVSGLGPEMAQAIIERFPTPSSLERAYAQCGGGDAAANLLAPVRTSTTRTVGTAVSRRVYASLFGHEATPLA